MCCTNYVWSCFVNCCVQYKCRAIHRLRSVHHFAIVIHQYEVTRFHVAETFAKRVHPKAVSKFWVACGDVSGNAFAVTKATKHAKRSGKPNFACTALVVNGVVLWSTNCCHFARLQFDSVNHAGAVLGCGHMARLAMRQFGLNLVT